MCDAVLSGINAFNDIAWLPAALIAACSCLTVTYATSETIHVERAGCGRIQLDAQIRLQSVSYTHLTLPTNREV